MHIPGAVIPSHPNVRRFQALLASGECPRLPHDHVLFETQGCVVAPTLGSILPYWLLVIPRAHYINFSQWRATTSGEPHQLVAEVLKQCGLDFDDAIWFEHGPAASGSIVGCGVDHAHLHVLINAPFGLDTLVSYARRASRLSWRSARAADAYKAIGCDRSYLLAASGDCAHVAQDVECGGSQFFRRIVAQLIGRTDEWDYTSYPHQENIERTIRAFDPRAT